MAEPNEEQDRWRRALVRFAPRWRWPVLASLAQKNVLASKSPFTCGVHFAIAKGSLCEMSAAIDLVLAFGAINEALADARRLAAMIRKL